MLPDRSLFYVKWGQAFVHFLPGKRLRDRSRQDIEVFIADLGDRPGIEDWQVRQAEYALKILYETFLPDCSPDAMIKPSSDTKRCSPLGHADVSTTMIYMHVLNRPGFRPKARPKSRSEARLILNSKSM